MLRLWLGLGLQLGVMVLTMTSVHAGLSGQFETLIKLDNRHFQSEQSIEERFDLVYDDPASNLRSGLSLALSQQQSDREAEITQIYLEKQLNGNRTLFSLGRLQRSDSLGFYALDGLLFKHVINKTMLTMYGGVPRRIENFRSIEGEALYGFDVQTSVTRFSCYKLDGRFGWQRFQQSGTVDRVNIGGRGIHQQATGFFPSAFSFSGSYLIDDEAWESIQLSAYRNFENFARLRLSYDTYEPINDKFTFKERFYSRYAHGRQSQFKAEYQFRQGYQQSWSLNGRRIIRELGGIGYATVASMDYRSNRGWRVTTQLDHLTLGDERFSGLYFETETALSSMLRGMLSGVLQQQQKRLASNNRSVGVEARLERRLKLKTLPSALWFSAQANYIHNSRLANEYRIIVRLKYRFDNRAWDSL